MTAKNSDLDMLAGRLRETEPRLPHEDFSAAVAGQLPRRHALPDWLKNSILLVATALGSAIAAARFPLHTTTALLAAAAAEMPLVTVTGMALAWATNLAVLWPADLR